MEDFLKEESAAVSLSQKCHYQTGWKKKLRGPIFFFVFPIKREEKEQKKLTETKQLERF